MTTTTNETQEQYEAREIKLYHAEARQRQATTRADIAEARANFAEFLADAEEVENRTNWLYDGTYGTGAMLIAQQIRAASERTNKAAKIAAMFANLDHGLTPAHAAKAYKTLTTEQQNAANAAIIAEMYDHARRQEEENAANAHLFTA